PSPVALLGHGCPLRANPLSLPLLPSANRPSAHSMTRRALNYRLLTWTAALLALSAVAVHIVHGAQVRRHGRTLLAPSEEAENGGELDRASVRLARYLQLVPDDTEVLARYADLLDQAAATPAARLRAIDVLRQVLARDPSREDLRRRLVALAMDAAAYTE